MAIATLSPTTPRAPSVARHAATLLDMIRATWARCRRPQTQLAKDVFRGRSKAVEHVCELIVELAHAPGTTLEEVEGLGLALAAIARSEHAAAHTAAPRLSVAEAHLLEEHAEGACDEAEARMAHNPSLGAYLNFLGKSAELNRARRILDESVRLQVARS